MLQHVACATSRTSAVSGLIRPFNNASALAPRMRYCDARGPGAPFDEIAGRFRRIRVARPRGRRQRNRIINHVIRNRRGQHELLHAQ